MLHDFVSPPSRRPGSLLARLAVATTLAALAALGVPASGGATINDKLVPSTGAYFGMFAGPPRAGRTWGQEMPYLESLVGRKFDLDRSYYFWDDTFPAWREKDAIAAGRIPVIGWSATTAAGSNVRWPSIANGSQDARIRARADAVKALGTKVMFIFHHEPEDDLSTHGTAADYRAAYRRVVSIFRARGATNVVWIWNMMAYTFNPNGPRPEDFYPGDDVVDWVAADGYNWYGSSHVANQPWRDFSTIFYSFSQWVKAKGKPGMVAEFGTREDPADPQRKARWFDAAAATMKTWPQLKGTIQFNGQEWHFDSSAPAISAFRAWGAQPYFNPRTASADTTKPTVAITNPANGSTVLRGSTVRIAAAASDDRGVTKVEFRVNGTLRCTDTTAPYTCDWKVYNTVGATNWIKATAYDAAGNSSSHSVSTGTL